MSKFKKGDIVTITGNTNEHQFEIGQLARICKASVTSVYMVEHLDGHDWWHVKENEMVLNEGAPERRVFKLIKATPVHPIGTLFKEDCNDGTQPYSTFELEGSDNYLKIKDRTKVEDQPKWFVEVFKVTPEYMTREELDAFEAFKRQRTTKTKTTVAKAAKPAARNGNKDYWTPARRKAHAARMRAIWESKKKAA